LKSISDDGMGADPDNATGTTTWNAPNSNNGYADWNAVSNVFTRVWMYPSQRSTNSNALDHPGIPSNKNGYASGNVDNRATATWYHGRVPIKDHIT